MAESSTDINELFRFTINGAKHCTVSWNKEYNTRVEVDPPNGKYSVLFSNDSVTSADIQANSGYKIVSISIDEGTPSGNNGDIEHSIAQGNGSAQITVRNAEGDKTYSFTVTVEKISFTVMLEGNLNVSGKINAGSVLIAGDAAATMAQVNTAIQTAVLDSWEGPY